MLLKTRVGGFANRVLRSTAGLWLPMQDLCVPLHDNILLVVDGKGGKRLYAAHNIVTDAGDTWYAQSACGETPTNDFDSLYLSSVNWTTTPAKDHNSSDIASMISGSEKAVSATYPKTNDADADNTGAGVDIVTWLFSYAKTDFNDADIEGGAISIASVPAWGSGSTPLLTNFNITSFAKTANDTLKVFVNHEMLGV